MVGLRLTVLFLSLHYDSLIAWDEGEKDSTLSKVKPSFHNSATKVFSETSNKTETISKTSMHTVSSTYQTAVKPTSTFARPSSKHQKTTGITTQTTTPTKTSVTTVFPTRTQHHNHTGSHSHHGTSSTTRLINTSAFKMTSTIAHSKTHSVVPSQSKTSQPTKTIQPSSSTPFPTSSYIPTTPHTPKNKTTPHTPKKKNMVILYATIFSVLGFVLTVIICVVVSGCRRTGLQSSFKFSQQLDTELGNFGDIPRAKLKNQESISGHCVTLNGGNDNIHNGIQVSPGGVEFTGKEPTDGFSGSSLAEESNVSIENRAYINTGIVLDDEDSS